MKIAIPEIEKLIHSTLDCFPTSSQLSLAFVDQKESVFMGFEKTEGSIKKVENHQLAFEIGSITKVFTTNVLAQLVLEGKIKLEENIWPYLSLLNPLGSPISFLQLANHTAGLERLPANFYTVKNHNQQDPYLNYGEKELLEYLKNSFTLLSDPGKQFAYSNFGFALLAHLISIIEKKPFTQVVKQRIFQPLIMKDASFRKSDLSIPLVAGLDPDGKTASNWHGGIHSGALGIFCNAVDFSQFIKAALDENNSAVQLQTKPSFEINPQYKIGLGWGIRATEEEHITLHHGGGSAGYCACLKLNKTLGLGVMVLSNVSAFHLKRIEVENLTRGLLKLLSS